jgi:hypothetical protein
MKIIDALLAELEQEAQTTRRVLERIPQAHLSWRPHPKSMSLGQLACTSPRCRAMSPSWRRSTRLQSRRRSSSLKPRPPTNCCRR